MPDLSLDRDAIKTGSPSPMPKPSEELIMYTSLLSSKTLGNVSISLLSFLLSPFPTNFNQIVCDDSSRSPLSSLSKYLCIDPNGDDIVDKSFSSIDLFFAF